MKKGMPKRRDHVGGDLKIGIVCSRWNEKITDRLLADCVGALHDAGVSDHHIRIIRVPGSFETVFAARYMVEKKDVDAVIAIGCLIKGETMHFEYIASAVSHGLMHLNATADVPVIFGILTCLTESQAIERSKGEKGEGYGWGRTAIEMARLKKDGDHL